MWPIREKKKRFQIYADDEVAETLITNEVNPGAVLMKTYRILVVVLCLLVVVLAYFAISAGKKPATEVAKEMWYTNNVETWHTNTVERWHTNAVEVTRTTTLVKPVTNEVVKEVEVVREVPAKHSALEKQAAVSGYNYINAPVLEKLSERLYKASPIAVDVSVAPSAANVVTEDAASIKKSIEAVLGSRNIQVGEKSPYHLSVNISKSWETDVPRVSLLVSKVELRENVVLTRQNDVIACPGVVWSAATSKLARAFNPAAEVEACIQESIDKFCNDYVEAIQAQKVLETRLPTMPHDFLAEGR